MEGLQMTKIVECKTLAEWRGVSFESSSGKTPQFVAFFKDFRREVKRQCVAAGLSVLDIYIGHFEASGFVLNPKTAKMAYFHISDVRFFPRSWSEDILIRTAKHDKDYTGGANHSCRVEVIGTALAALTGPREVY
jgi:hypothetical protein